MANKVFIGASLDGYIADRNGGLDFLDLIPNPEQSDLGYNDFIKSVDALLMGRRTFETVLGFDVPWPYSIPVFVLSSKLKQVPEKLSGMVEIVSGDLKDIVTRLNKGGFSDLYIDGGKLIQSFLAEDLIDELIITRIPVLIGGGTPLFGNLPGHLQFELVKSEVLLNHIVQCHYRRKRTEKKN